MMVFDSQVGMKYVQLLIILSVKMENESGYLLKGATTKIP